MSDDIVTRRIELDLSSDALWSAISDPEMLEQWLGDRVDLELVSGATGVIVDDGVARQVVIDHVEVGRGWSFRWSVDGEPESHVTIAIGESHVTITERLSAEASAAGHGFRWDVCTLLLWVCAVASTAAALVR
jgi:uncharacterized protein YndB with AHSA1/START domain